jgi:hypothetical protein
MTSELCSDRASVLGSLPLGAPSSRCSLDLSPLRGSPAQPLGLRPPLMCLLHLRFPRLATSLPLVSRHSRVSIRPNLETALTSGFNLREVCTSSAPLGPSYLPEQAPVCTSELLLANEVSFSVSSGVTLCADLRPTEVNLDLHFD